MYFFTPIRRTPPPTELWTVDRGLWTVDFGLPQFVSLLKT